MYKVSAVILNYNRPHYIPKVIESLRAQQHIDLEIILWDNNPTDETFDVDVHIKSSHNYICQPRYFMGAISNSEYVITLDDDMILTELNTIVNMILLDKHLELTDLIQGPHGKRIADRDTYNGIEIHIGNIDDKKNYAVDVVKGRSMFMRRKFLETIPMHNAGNCDDIYINSFSNNKIVPGVLVNSFENLEEGDEGLCMSTPNWGQVRTDAITKYFKTTKICKDYQ